MQIQDAAQAKQILQDRAREMNAAYQGGAQEMKQLATRGRKIIEDNTRSASMKGSEDLLGTL